MPKNTPIKGIILDMDGVLWRAGHPIGDLPALFDRMNRLGLRVMLATNNATKSVAQFLAQFARLGVSLEPWQVLTSAVVTAAYLQAHYPKGTPVFVIGEDALRDTLREYGLAPLPADEMPVETPPLVVVGMDWHCSYQRLRHATLLIRRGAAFIGTNPDRTFPTPEGLVPGAGSLLAALEAATDTPPHIMGKPAPEMFYQCLQRLGTAPEETVMVGDRLETDIRGAAQVGLRTALVLSGVATRPQAEAATPAPDWIAENLEEFLGRTTDHGRRMMDGGQRTIDGRR